MIYLDHAATTAVYPQVMKEMIPFFSEEYFNPSSGYQGGVTCRKKIEKVRVQIAETIHAEPDEIFFTAGGTEADNWALTGMAELGRKRGRHLITTQIEHHAVLHTCQNLEKKGFEVTYLPVNAMGIVEPETVARAIRPDTIGISVMLANNEIGTLQPIDEIGRLANAAQIPFHTDAVQGYGHLPLDVRNNIDLLSASAHKFGGPKGVGFLYIRKGLNIPSFIHGGAQEKQRRAGTENVPGIIGMGEAARISEENRLKNHKRIIQMRDYLMTRILSEVACVRLNGDIINRLPGNLNLCFDFIEGQSLIVMLEMKGIYISGGSACTSADHNPSHVLTALGLTPQEARGSIRITIGEENTMEEMDTVVLEIKQIAGDLRSLSKEYIGFNKNCHWTECKK